MSLERVHRFCVKFIQFLQKSTSTDVALALIAFNSLETEIDYRKLIFLGQLCRLQETHIPRSAVVNTELRLYFIID